MIFLHHCSDHVPFLPRNLCSLLRSFPYWGLPRFMALYFIAFHRCCGFLQTEGQILHQKNKRGRKEGQKEERVSKDSLYCVLPYFIAMDKCTHHTSEAGLYLTEPSEQDKETGTHWVGKAGNTRNLYKETYFLHLPSKWRLSRLVCCPLLVHTWYKKYHLILNSILRSTPCH